MAGDFVTRGLLETKKMSLANDKFNIKGFQGCRAEPRSYIIGPAERLP